MLQPGTRIGEFEISAPRKGGMGEVYEAQQARLNAASPSKSRALARENEEALIAFGGGEVPAKSYPAIVRIFQTGKSKVAYYVMQLVNGFRSPS